jgi:rod shape-determining protein MreC
MRRPLVLVFILLFVAALMTAWHRAAQRSGGISAPEGVTFTAMGFVQRPLWAVGGWFSDVSRAMFRRGGTIEENAQLREEVANLRGQTQRLMRYRQENFELRAQLEMPKPPGGKNIAAEVLAVSANDYRRRIVLNVGSRQGVKPKDAVFCAQGVVGQVIEVSPLSCRVLLLTDTEASIGAMVQRTTVRGVVGGTGERIATMKYLNFNADVREGDLVVTSGESQIFPKGLIVGRVLATRRDKNYSRLSATVDLAAPFDQLSAVFVRTTQG